jgi:hypothetical protein
MLNDLNAALSGIVKDPDLHAQWLNTFSYLEYIGFRKIIKSQKTEVITAEILEHAAEEGRHALLLKNLAIRVGGLKYNAYNEATLLCGHEAKNYFQELDRTCAASLRSVGDSQLQAKLVYLYVTWLVEQRALKIYSLYKSKLEEAGQKLPLSGLLAEEKSHLEAVQVSLINDDAHFHHRKVHLQVLENKLFEVFLKSLFVEVDRAGRKSEVHA